MKRLKLRWIIGLMGFSMIGLIALQLYWIDGMVKANEERFRKDVMEALNNVASKLEKQEAIETYNRLHQFNLREEAERAQLVRKREERVFRQPKKNQPQIEVVRQGNQEVFMFFDTVELGEDFQFVINFSSGMSGGGYWNDYSQSMALEDAGTAQDKEIKSLENQLARVSKKYELTLDVVKDLMMPGRSLISRFNPARLDSLLNKELKNKGIAINYEYGVVASRLNKFVVLTHEQKKKELNESELRASLFPNDVFENNSKIVIDFPTKQKFLISKIWSSLISSGFLVVVILFCFGYSIRTIVHQKKLSEMKNDFINNMTHEFKTPIATVSLAVESLTDKEIESSSLKEKYLKVIHDENKRLGDQVEKVLQIATIDKQDYHLKEEKLLMNEIVRNATEHISMQVERRDGRLNLIENADQDEVKGDKTHLTNIILNLLDNANKYSPEAPNITLRTENRDDQFSLTVQDKGMGMSRDEQKHIFQKFYRVHTGDVHDVKGFGLGLAYVQNMVAAHGGKIEVESEVGKGSKFSIILPLIDEA